MYTLLINSVSVILWYNIHSVVPMHWKISSTCVFFLYGNGETIPRFHIDKCYLKPNIDNGFTIIIILPTASVIH